MCHQVSYALVLSITTKVDKRHNTNPRVCEVSSIFYWVINYFEHALADLYQCHLVLNILLSQPLNLFCMSNSNFVYTPLQRSWSKVRYTGFIISAYPFVCPSVDKTVSGQALSVFYYTLEIHSYSFHFVRRPFVLLSVCGQKRVCSCVSTLLARSISYLYMSSTNSKKCVACWV